MDAVTYQATGMIVVFACLVFLSLIRRWIGEKYRHYKGNVYEVTGFAKHSETGEKLVIYRSVEHPEDVWARPYDMFVESLWHAGQKINRFELI